MYCLVADTHDIQLEVICTGKLEVYIDGYYQQASNVTSLLDQLIYTYSLKPTTANLIGIRCLSTNKTGAIVARTIDEIMSNSSWKVAVGITDSDWTTACYDDSQWLIAETITNLNWPELYNVTWKIYPGGNPPNNWVYYRKLLRK